MATYSDYVEEFKKLVQKKFSTAVVNTTQRKFTDTKQIAALFGDVTRKAKKVETELNKESDRIVKSAKADSVDIVKLKKEFDEITEKELQDWQKKNHL
jgi:phage host-nuclease inhibitor protein Gam